METDPTAVAAALFATLEAAWNAGDGKAFSAPFARHNDFVDIRGTHHFGDRSVVAEGHQAIFDTIYRQSQVSYTVAVARRLSGNCLLAVIDATLDAPDGPLKGLNHSKITAVIVHEDDAWRITSFHNTLVFADPRTTQSLPS